MTSYTFSVQSFTHQLTMDVFPCTKYNCNAVRVISTFGGAVVVHLEGDGGGSLPVEGTPMYESLRIFDL